MKSVILENPGAYEIVWRALGAKVGSEICRNDRDTVMTILRKEYDWQLARIGETFGLTRERVRQIVNDPGRNTGRRYGKRVTGEEKKRVFRELCRSPGAWYNNGRIKKSWLAKRLDHKTLSDINLNDYEFSKFQIIMRYGLELETEQEQLDQMREWQFGSNYMSYQEIAEMLSKQFVPISTMGIHRGAQHIGFKGHSTGAPGQPRQYRTFTGAGGLTSE